MTRRRGTDPQFRERGSLFAKIQRLTSLLDRTTDPEEKKRIRRKLARLRNLRARKEGLDDND